MKRMIAGILAGIVLGISGTAVAAGGYWNKTGHDYTCEGVTSGVSCKSGGYEIGITKDYVYLKKGFGTPRTATTVGCKKWEPWSYCITP